MVYKTLLLSSNPLSEKGIRQPPRPPPHYGGTGAVVEFCDSQVLLQREQHYLDIIFSLADNLRIIFHQLQVLH